MKLRQIDGETLKKMFIQGAYKLSKNREVVDSLNVFPVPDGDTGTNMFLTMESAVSEISKIKEPSISNIAKAIADGSLMGARGNSGVILSQIFRGFEKACKDKEVLSIKDFSTALKSASDVAYKAVMKPIEGTILTIIREVSKKALEITSKNLDFNEFFSEIIEYGEKILEKTPDMLNALKQAGVVDAGGKGLIFILKGFEEALNGEISEEEINTYSSKVQIKDEHDGVIEFGYCTEFIIKGNSSYLNELKNKIKNLGDSMLVVGDEDLIKVHIHTNNPGKVIEYGLEIGELINIKIDNMRYQHQNKVVANKDIKKTEEKKKYGIISVAMGEGLYNIFKDLNVDKVISGGQTMNPSTEDIVKAINEINADNIFILPNNSNIILAANQAKEITEKNVFVIPTKTIPQGITSLIQFDPSLSIKENFDNMMEALNNVKTVQITYSVRDSSFKDLKINKGDILGIADGEIISVGNSINSVADEALRKVINDEHEILTIYYGSEISEETANEFASKMEEIYPELDIEVYFGGQPLYYYIFSVE
ncbi:hypothetical protein SAMN02745883_00202 [Caminicella sporogenes DSM 14501]|uniref:DhaL domain-containing protein n=1 Tax=Caminicella sporogenes DSM 14501 TaxID=1121266 RepID=A0A1M6LGY8_9FIRM|nr:DAK2 domain-containing protein [Caminicella sporogenes]SHJ70427.1 hypothetical protein SAMN02745883_00202 [Caminicella sporogenes DSM 14501]